jgi:hypothetical protein
METLVNREISRQRDIPTIRNRWQCEVAEASGKVASPRKHILAPTLFGIDGTRRLKFQREFLDKY